MGGDKPDSLVKFNFCDILVRVEPRGFPRHSGPAGAQPEVRQRDSPAGPGQRQVKDIRQGQACWAGLADSAERQKFGRRRLPVYVYRFILGTLFRSRFFTGSRTQSPPSTTKTEQTKN